MTSAGTPVKPYKPPAHPARLPVRERGAAGLVAVLLALGVGCPPAPSTPPTPTPDAGGDDAGVDDPIAACLPLESGELVLQGVEAEPDFDAIVRDVDVDSRPATISLIGASSFALLLVRYLLEGDALDATGTVLDTRAAAARGPAGLTVLAAVADSGDVDVTILRRGLHRFYACDRALPTSLTAFLATVHDWSADPRETIPSTVKGLRRRIFRSAEAGVFVAETLLEDDTVRETEIILTDRRADAGLDFLEYDAAGVLRGASRFAASGGGQTTGPTPFACLACHGTDVVSPPPP